MDCNLDYKKGESHVSPDFQDLYADFLDVFIIQELWISSSKRPTLNNAHPFCQSYKLLLFNNNLYRKTKMLFSRLSMLQNLLNFAVFVLSLLQ